MEIKGKVFTKGQKQGEETPTVAEETSYLLSLCLPTWRLFVSSQQLHRQVHSSVILHACRLHVLLHRHAQWKRHHL